MRVEEDVERLHGLRGSGVYHGHAALRRDGRRRGVQQRPAAHPGEYRQVEEVHRAQHQQDDAFLRAQRFEDALQVGDFVVGLQREADEADVDQVESDDEQVVDGNRPGASLPWKVSTRKMRPLRCRVRATQTVIGRLMAR